MSKFTRHISNTFHFDGDDVYVEMQRLKRKDAMKLMPYMEDGEEMTQTQQSALIEAASGMLSKYIVKFSGLVIEDAELLFDRNGDNINGSSLVEKRLEDVIDSAYFITLVSEMVAFLIEKSFLSEEEEEKSESLPESILEDTATTTDSTSQTNQ